MNFKKLLCLISHDYQPISKGPYFFECKRCGDLCKEKGKKRFSFNKSRENKPKPIILQTYNDYGPRPAPPPTFYQAERLLQNIQNTSDFIRQEIDPLINLSEGEAQISQEASSNSDYMITTKTNSSPEILDAFMITYDHKYRLYKEYKDGRQPQPLITTKKDLDEIRKYLNHPNLTCEIIKEVKHKFNFIFGKT